jgi:hypothetical protein
MEHVMPVVAGKHHVEIAWLSCPQTMDNGFILQFHEETVVVGSGETKFVEYQIPPNKVGFPTSAWDGQHRYFDDYPTNVTVAEDEVTRKLGLIPLDLMVQALARLQSEVSRVPPKGPTAHLEIPESHGGAREVDGDQIRAITGWLKYKYWGKWRLVKVPSEPELQSSYQRWLAADDMVKKSMEGFEEFNAIARILDRAE